MKDTAFGRNSELIRRFCTGFSNPAEPFDEEFLEFLSAKYGLSLVGNFLSDYGKYIAGHSASLYSFIGKWLESESSFQEVWDPVFGRLHLLFQETKPDSDRVVSVAVDLALALGHKGFPGYWETVCPNKGQKLRFDRWTLPDCSRITVRSSTTEISIKLEIDGKERELVFDPRGKRWLTPVDEAGLKESVYSENVVFLADELRDVPEYDYLADVIVEEKILVDAVRLHTAAMKLLREVSPRYAKWVERVVRCIIPLDSEYGNINSGSSRHEPGIVHASINCSVEAYAEMLVHESSHQYLYLLTRLGPVDDGSDEKGYYSPIKERDRPIGYILIAFHAFANVLLFGRDCLKNTTGLDADYFLQNEDFLLPRLKILEDGLASTNALTDIGYSLWQPLSERIRSPR